MPRLKIRQRRWRARIWLLAPLVPGEAALVSLFVIATILAGSFYMHRDPALSLVVAAVMGGCTRLAGFRVASRPR